MKLAKHETKVSIALALLALLLVLSGLIYHELRSKFELPAPTGSYQVGYQERILVDSARQDNTPDRSHRRLIISIYYPAAAVEGERGLYLPPQEPITANLAEVVGVPEAMVRHVAHGKTNAYQNAPLAALDEFPVVVFSHGMSGIRVQSSFLLEELASNGYLVVSIEHHGYSIGSIFPDGSRGDFMRENVLQDISAGADIIATWSEDQLFVYNELRRLNDQKALFSRKIKMGKAGLVGHSFGGAASFNTMVLNEDFASAVNLDGFYFGSNYARGTSKPLLEIRSEPTPVEEVNQWFLKQAGMSREQYRHMLFDEWERRFGLYAKGPAYSYMLQNAHHLSFTDLVLAVPFKGLLLRHHQQHHSQIRILVKSFLDHTLKDLPEERFRLANRPAARHLISPDEPLQEYSMQELP